MCKPERFDKFKRQATVNILWSFASLRFYPLKFLTAASQLLGRCMHTFSDQELSNCIWAFGRLGHHPGPLLQPMLDCVEAQVSSSLTLALPTRQPGLQPWLSFPDGSRCRPLLSCLVLLGAENV